MPEFSDYIVYVDESGDHNLDNVYPEFPLFCLCFCVIKKTQYISSIVPSFQKFKFKYWGHDCVVLHEHEIRKSKNDFTFLLTDAVLREKFYNDLNALMEKADMSIFASVIDKAKLKVKYTSPNNPYNLGLLFCMEQLLNFLTQHGETGKSINVVFESRGKSEDRDLEIVFRRICDNQENWGYRNPDFRKIEFEPKFVSKSVNSTGLQLADLTARPIAINYLRPAQRNIAFSIIQKKLERKAFP